MDAVIKRKIPLDKQTLPITEDAPNKRQKTSSASSLVTTNLGCIAESIVKEDDIKQWKACSPSQARQAMVKASAELYFHTMTQQSYMEEDLEARIQALELEIKSLKKDLSNANKKYDKLQKEYETEIISLKKEVTRLKEVVEVREKTITEITEATQELGMELDQLKVNRGQGWADSIKKVKSGMLILLVSGTAYAGSLPSILSMIGVSLEKPVTYMKEFLTLEAEQISAKNVLIEAEKAKAAAEREQARPDVEPSNPPDASSTNVAADA